MAQYLFHLHECGDIIEDEEGRELASAADALDQAIREARDLMAAEVASGKLCLGCHIEVVNAATGKAFSVPFRSAIKIEDAAPPYRMEEWV